MAGDGARIVVLGLAVCCCYRHGLAQQQPYAIAENPKCNFAYSLCSFLD